MSDSNRSAGGRKRDVPPATPANAGYRPRRERQQTVFTPGERLLFGLVVVAALVGVYRLLSGAIAV